MARQRKYPLWPGPGEKEVPYDTAHFMMWCVDEECMSPKTADVYVSHIRKAFETVFNSNYSIFEILAQAFRGYIHHPEICLKNLEKASDYLGELIILMSLLPPTEFFENRGLKGSDKTLADWVRAFSAYHRYYEWRIDKLRVELGHPTEISVSKKDLMLPLKKEFSEYLKKECHYSSASVWSHVSYLTKIKNLFLSPLIDDMDELDELDKDIFDVIAEEESDWESISSILKDLIDTVDIEIEMVELNLPDKKSFALTVNDLKRGKHALCKYYDFLKESFKKKQSIKI